MAFIDAQIIELQTTVPLSRETDQRSLLRLAEYARFLEAEHDLDRLSARSLHRVHHLGAL